MERTWGIRLLLIGFVLLTGLGVAVATGAVRAGKPVPKASGPVIPSLGTAKNGVFAGSGVTFRYPTGWRTLPPQSTPVGELGPTRRIVIGSGTGSDRVVVQAFRLQAPITDAEKTGVMGQVGSSVSAFVSSQHGTMETPVAEGKLGALPAFTATASWPGTGGATMHGRFYFGYQGYAIFEVTCQRATTAPAQIDAGCDQIVETFRVA